MESAKGKTVMSGAVRLPGTQPSETVQVGVTNAILDGVQEEASDVAARRQAQ